MTAPRPREQADPPSPPDRLPPRRGGGFSPCTYAVSAAGRPAGPARLRAARALAAAALLALSGALALPAQAQTTCTVTPGDLWCGTLTIGSFTGPGGANHGYLAAANAGSLSPNTFTHEGTTITVESVVHFVPTLDNPNLQFITSPALPSGYNFVLQAGSESFSFAGGETSYNFYDIGAVDWSMSDGQTVTLRLREAPSENATLSGLVVNDGSMDLALSPAFAPATTSYAAWVPKAVEKVTVTPTTLNPNATIEYLDANGMMIADAGTEDGRQVALAAGENVIQVKVTAQDDTATQTYTVTVTRAAVEPPAAPTGLSATAGNGRVALAWNAQASDAVITHHEYRYKTDSDYQDNWKTIPFSAPGGFNEDGFTVTGLDNGTAHTFQLRAVNAGGESDAVESSAVTPSGSGRIVESITMRRYDGQDGHPYGVGDEMVFVVKFSQNIRCVSNESLKVRFNLGSATKEAGSYAGTGTDTRWYRYTVQEDDVDSDGIEIPAGSQALPDRYYSDDGCNNVFDESGIKAQGPFPDRKVDGVYPSLASAVVDGAELVLTWNETLRDDSVPAAGDFAVTVAGASRNVGSVAVAGSAVTLTLASAVTSGQTVTVSYTKGTNPLKDLASNDAPGLTDEAVRNSRTAPAAPTNFSASAGNGYVTLVWDAPASDADITRHEYRHKTGASYPANWTRIPNSAPGGANASRFRVTGLSNDTAYTFQVRAVNGSVAGAAVETGPATPVRPPPIRPQTTNFYLWRTTLTVGEDSGTLGYDRSDSLGSISTSAKFGHPPWNPPRKHHFDPDSYIIVEAIRSYEESGDILLAFQIDDIGKLSGKPGKLTLWLARTAYPVSVGSVSMSQNAVIFNTKFGDTPDVTWEEDDEVRVALVYERRLPSAPQNVRVTAPPGEDGTLEVSWDEPEFEGTFPVECYLVEFRHPSGEAKKRKQSYPGSLGPGKGCGESPPTSVRRTDLDKGVQYQVLVQALSGDGFSEWSETKTARAGGRSLRAWFESPPERHDGKKRVKVQVAFSEPIDGTPETVGEHGVDVEGGRVTSVRPVGGDAPGGAGNRSAGGRNAGREDREVVWEFEIEPDSDGDVTVSLDAGRPCDEPGAICTADGRSLSEGIATTVEGPDTGPAGLTAAFEGMPESHDGEGGFRFRVAFSENIGISYRSLREDAFTVTGGPGHGRPPGGRPARPVRDDGAARRRRRRDDRAAGGARVRGLRRDLHQEQAPAAAHQHAGGDGGRPRGGGADGALRGYAGGARRADGVHAQARVQRGDQDERPEAAGRRRGGGRRPGDEGQAGEQAQGPVEADGQAGFAGGRDGDARGRGRLRHPGGGVHQGRAPAEAVTNTISTTVLGPAALSVADARAEEGSDETIDFAVSLSREAHASVTVDYTTAAGSATAGEDYTRTSGTLSFAPGETEKTVAVPVLDDAIDEGEETFTLRLSDATGAVIADGTATGTIENSDPLQKMWLSRFGRTVAGQVVDAVAGRLSGPTGGSQVTLGGQSIDLSSLSADTGDARRTLAGALGAARVTNDDGPLAGPGAWETARAGAWEDPETGGTVRSMTGRELLLGSSFHLAAGGGEAGGPGYAAWGRMAVGGFDAEAPAEKGTVRLDGEVTTGILGADAEWERWLAGVALSVSEGEGTFDQPGVDSGTVESSLTSVNPYVRYEASDRLSVWGLVGYGTGDMTMTQAARGERAEIVTRTDLMLRLGAAGARGVLLEAGEDGGIDLALRGDAFLVQMESEAAANTVETKADASRLRLVLEAGRSFALGEGAVLTPALELGLRHDGGDAETGTGVEVGGRIRYSDTGSGLTVEANARTLVAHEDSGYREWGAGGSVRLDPGASGRGLSLSLSPVWGTPSSGVERLWSARDAAGLVRDEEFEAERRLKGEIGYGLGAFGGHGLVTPYAGLSLAAGGGRAWRLGARWNVAPDVTFGLEGTRRESGNDDEPPQHGLMLRGVLRW